MCSMQTLTLALIVLSFFFEGVVSSPVVGDYVTYDQVRGKPYTVTFDERSFIINNKRTLLLGGAIHPPRISVGDVADVMQKAKADGLNHVQIYVFWNYHEPAYDFSGTHKYIWTGRANLSNFFAMAADAGLFVNVRIGPYVCAEWSFGGLPTWLLHYGDKISFRDNNPIWKSEMETFVRKIADLMKPYLARVGGPIILAQIENEYRGSQAYIDWCGQLTVDLALDIPWVMCNGASAKQTVNTCNGNDCYGYAQSHSKNFPGQPLGWTENEGWFETWQGRHVNSSGWDNRSPQDVAYVVTIWFAAGGAHHNYYMWYGGNHLAHWAGSGITNKYADGVNYHANGLPNEPKKSHLQKLHNVLADIQRGLLEDSIQVNKQMNIPATDDPNCGSKCVAFLYRGMSAVYHVTFLANFDSKTHQLKFNNQAYSLEGRAVAILDWQGTELYNTARVNTMNIPTRTNYRVLVPGSSLKWGSWVELLPQMEQNLRHDSPITSMKPLEQIRLTNDTTEYVFYSTEVNVASAISKVTIELAGRAANVYFAFIGAAYCGISINEYHGRSSVKHTITCNMNVGAGKHLLSIVSSAKGIDNGIANMHPSSSQDMKGITGNISMNGADITNSQWSQYIGRTGELAQVAGAGTNKVQWKYPANTSEPMTWYKTSFNTPSQTDLDSGVMLMQISTAPDCSNGLGRGHFWLNGVDMGHYDSIAYTNPTECAQRYYYLPKDMLMAPGKPNVLVLGEELSGVKLDGVSIVVGNVMI